MNFCQILTLSIHGVEINNQTQKMSMYTGFILFIDCLKKTFYFIAHFLYISIIKPRSGTEDSKRQEFLLNSILSGIIFVLILLDISILYNSLTDHTYSSIRFWKFSIIIILFGSLLLLSRYGWHKISSYIFIAGFFVATLYGSITWGIGLPASLLSYSLIITISSVLISSQFGMVVAFIIITTLILLGIEESYLKTIPTWKQHPTRITDAIQYSTILLVTVVTSWLSNREMEKSLMRARKAEKDIAIERDSLEIKVEERTKEIKRMQIEKIGQLYRFAEFGKLSSGIFHDLINPLNAVSLNITELDRISRNSKSIQSKKCLEHAISASKRMESFISAIKRQMQSQENKMKFDIKDEVTEVIQILSHKARKAQVDIIINIPDRTYLFSNPLYINRVLTNLISNAIDAYEHKSIKAKKKIVIISTKTDTKQLTIEVSDFGIGIDKTNLDKIFEPFFTTKATNAGLGLGLSTTKDIVEKDLHGKITVTSTPEVQTTFTITIPHVTDNQETTNKTTPSPE